MTKIDGAITKWFSTGRGDLETRACLLDSGRTVYNATRVPPEQTTAIEHKWYKIHVRSDAELAADDEVDEIGVDEFCDDTPEHQLPRRIQFVEIYRYDPNGVEDDKSLRCRRVFEVRREE